MGGGKRLRGTESNGFGNRFGRRLAGTSRPGLAGSATGPVGEGGTSPRWISAAPLDDGRQLVLIIDPQMRNAAVYHVDGATGSLTLRSTRNIAWDLLVPEYNAQEPRPATLKKMLEVGAEGVPAGQTRP